MSIHHNTVGLYPVNLLPVCLLHCIDFSQLVCFKVIYYFHLVYSDKLKNIYFFLHFMICKPVSINFQDSSSTMTSPKSFSQVYMLKTTFICPCYGATGALIYALVCTSVKFCQRFLILCTMYLGLI